MTSNGNGTANGSGQNNGKERKFRRTHKNSRDGCINCKTKRIKCSEELPQCFNCVKKNYRCSYLDFPKEKLDHIRMKNEKKRKEMLAQGNSHHSSEDFAKATHGVDQVSANMMNSMGGVRLNSNSSSMMGHPTNGYNNVDLSNSSNSPLNQDNQLFAYQPMDQQQPYMQQQNYPQSQHPNNMVDYYRSPLKDYYESKDSLRHALYLDTFQLVTQRTLPDQNDILDFPSARDKFFHKNVDTPAYDYDPKINNPNGEKLDFSRIKFSDAPLDMDFNQFNSNQFVNFDNNSVNYLTTLNSKSPAQQQSKNSIKLNPLPNAIHEPTFFKRLVPIYSRKAYKNRKLVTSTMQYFYAPCWNNDIVNRVWINVYSLSDVITVYLSYFLDRSLNILLSNLSNILNNDYLKHIHNTYQMLEGPNQNSEDFFINETVLKRLTAKSYVYYGNLIRELRTSLMEFHAEYTVKVSFFSSYSTLLQLHSSVDTLVSTYHGTASLLLKYVSDSKSIDELTPTLKVIIDLFTNHSLTSKVPDLGFDLVPALFRRFVDFKNFLITHTTVYQEQDTNSVRDFIIKHDCIEFDKFFKFLMEDFDPKVRALNEEYKQKVGIYDMNPNNLYFISFTSFFELLSKWFSIYPSLSMNMGSKISPFKKVFYLFFNVMGKMLNSIYSPIRSVLMIDCCNLFCTNVQFPYQVYELNRDELNNYQYNYLTGLSQHMLKLIHYLNSRTMFYGHKLSNDTVLNHNYLQQVGRDVVQIKPQKMETSEVPLQLDGKDPSFHLRFENFPQFDDFEFDSYQTLIHSKQSNNEEFNYKIGLHENDFNCEAVLKRFIHQQKVKWELNQPGLREIKQRMENFESSRRTINQSIVSGAASYE